MMIRLALLIPVVLLAACASAPRAAPPAPIVDSTAIVAPVPAVDSAGLPAEFYAAFRAADTRARAITYWLQCVPTIAQLRASGRFGAGSAAPRMIYWSVDEMWIARDLQTRAVCLRLPWISCCPMRSAPSWSASCAKRP